MSGFGTRENTCEKFPGCADCCRRIDRSGAEGIGSCRGPIGRQASRKPWLAVGGHSGSLRGAQNHYRFGRIVSGRFTQRERRSAAVPGRFAHWADPGTISCHQKPEFAENERIPPLLELKRQLHEPLNAARLPPVTCRRKACWNGAAGSLTAIRRAI